MDFEPSNSTTTLPTARQLLTTLLQTLTSSSSTNLPSNLPPGTHTTQNQIQTTETTQVNPPYSSPPSNPLKSLPASQKAILSTLHVLFPPPMLLQALDLLDRGLVARVTLSSSDGVSAKCLEKQDVEMVIVKPPQAHIHLLSLGQGEKESNEEAGEEKKTGRENYVFQVRSSQPVKGRFRDTSSLSGGGNIYTVRLEAWNCSCAAFAFSAFPSSSSPSYSAPWKGMNQAESNLDEELGEADGEEDVWEFGGLSLDGEEGGNVPVCKHLLACLLGERWDLLERYVKKREVEREEMAGVGGEG